MVEQKGAPQKKNVGSLFFHLFNRISLWIYTLLCNSIPARLLTSYDVLEARWREICEFVFGTAGGKLRRNLHSARISVAGYLERSKILRLFSRLVSFLAYCPLNVYGIFFFVYGALGAAVYFIATRLSVNYAGEIGWGIAGIVIVIGSLPLLCSSKPLYFAAFGSRTLGKILRQYLGLERKGKPEKKERGNTVLVYLALLFGAVLGGCTFFYHPATVPICIALLAAVLLIMRVPEAGILLALGSMPFWWCTGQPMLCAVAISLVTLISFVSKLIHGRRVMHFRLVDFTVLMFGLVIVLNGVLAGGGVISVLYMAGYCVMLAMYFPVVNLMHSRDWMQRCYKLLVISGAVLSVMNLLSFINLLSFEDKVLAGADLSALSVLLERYNTYFSDPVAISGMLLMLIPIMLSGMIGKRSMSSVFWRALWVIAGCVSVVLFMQFGPWIGLGIALLVFFFAYSYKALSASFLLAFPVTCGAVWATELDRMFGVRHTEPVQAAQNVVVTFCNAEAYRRTVFSSVRQMAKHHVLGVGWGEQAFGAAFPYYAQPGMESMTNTENTFLQLLARSGWGAVILLLAVLLIFTMYVLTYLRRGSYAITKARVAAGLAGVCGVLLMGLTCDVWASESVFILFWLVLALTVTGIRTQYDVLARAVQTHGATADQAHVTWSNKIKQRWENRHG